MVQSCSVSTGCNTHAGLVEHVNGEVHDRYDENGQQSQDDNKGQSQGPKAVINETHLHTQSLMAPERRSLEAESRQCSPACTVLHDYTCCWTAPQYKAELVDLVCLADQCWMEGASAYLFLGNGLCTPHEDQQRIPAHEDCHRQEDHGDNLHQVIGGLQDFSSQAAYTRTSGADPCAKPGLQVVQDMAGWTWSIMHAYAYCVRCTQWLLWV